MSGQEKPTLRRNIFTPFESIKIPPEGLRNHDNITTCATSIMNEINGFETAAITAAITH